MNSSSNFKKVLQYHWSQMVVGSTEGTQVDPKTLELIVKKVDPLELCELLDADPRQETEALNIFGKSMEQELMNSTAGFRKCVAKIDKDRSSSRFPFFLICGTPQPAMLKQALPALWFRLPSSQKGTTLHTAKKFVRFGPFYHLLSCYSTTCAQGETKEESS